MGTDSLCQALDTTDNWGWSRSGVRTQDWSHTCSHPISINSLHWEWVPHTTRRTINEVNTTQFYILNKKYEILNGHLKILWRQLTYSCLFIRKKRENLFIKKDICKSKYFFFHGKFSFISGLDTNFWKGWIDWLLLLILDWTEYNIKIQVQNTTFFLFHVTLIEGKMFSFVEHKRFDWQTKAIFY